MPEGGEGGLRSGKTERSAAPIATNGPPPGGSPQVAMQAGRRQNSAGSSNRMENGPCGQADSGLSRHEAGFDRPIRWL